MGRSAEVAPRGGGGGSNGRDPDAANAGGGGGNGVDPDAENAGGGREGGDPARTGGRIPAVEAAAAIGGGAGTAAGPPGGGRPGLAGKEPVAARATGGGTPVPC